MRNWIMLAVMVVAVCAPNAHADSFSVTFTGTPTPTASDVTFPSPTLDIIWQGVAFSVTLPSSWLSTDAYEWGSSRVCNSPSTCTADIIIFDDTQSSSATTPSVDVSLSFAIAPGTGAGAVIFAPVVAPEPSSVALLLLGIGLVFVLRKRNSHQLAT